MGTADTPFETHLSRGGLSRGRRRACITSERFCFGFWPAIRRKPERSGTRRPRGSDLGGRFRVIERPAAHPRVRACFRLFDGQRFRRRISQRRLRIRCSGDRDGSARARGEDGRYRFLDPAFNGSKSSRRSQIAGGNAFFCPALPGLRHGQFERRRTSGKKPFRRALSCRLVVGCQQLRG